MTAPSQSSAARVLIDARELIRQGWTKGRSHRRVFGRDCYCAGGAIGVVGAAVRDPALRKEVATRLRRAMSPAGYGIAEWNDAPERTKAEVLAAFDRAIEAAS